MTLLFKRSRDAKEICNADDRAKVRFEVLVNRVSLHFQRKRFHSTKPQVVRWMRTSVLYCLLSLARVKEKRLRACDNRNGETRRGKEM